MYQVCRVNRRSKRFAGQALPMYELEELAYIRELIAEY